MRARLRVSSAGSPRSLSQASPSEAIDHERTYHAWFVDSPALSPSARAQVSSQFWKQMAAVLSICRPVT